MTTGLSGNRFLNFPARSLPSGSPGITASVIRMSISSSVWSRISRASCPHSLAKTAMPRRSSGRIVVKRSSRSSSTSKARRSKERVSLSRVFLGARCEVDTLDVGKGLCVIVRCLTFSRTGVGANIKERPNPTHVRLPVQQQGALRP